MGRRLTIDIGAMAFQAIVPQKVVLKNWHGLILDPSLAISETKKQLAALVDQVGLQRFEMTYSSAGNALYAMKRINAMAINFDTLMADDRLTSRFCSQAGPAYVESTNGVSLAGFRVTRAGVTEEILWSDLNTMSVMDFITQLKTSRPLRFYSLLQCNRYLYPDSTVDDGGAAMYLSTSGFYVVMSALGIPMEEIA